MKLYLAQHGAAATAEVDPERPLTAGGREAVTRLAGLLGKRQIRVDRVVHSGKLRAAQTAAILADSIAPGTTLETRDSINPMDMPTVITEEIDQWRQDTLVVGHLPFMAKLATLFVNGHEDPPMADFTPGTVLCLERADGVWQINWMLRPELLG